MAGLALVKPLTKMFSSDTPSPTPAPAAPSVADDSARRAAEEEARLRSNRGRASTIFAGESSSGATAKRVLLGAGA